MSRLAAFLRRDLLVELSYPWAFAAQAAALVGQIILWLAASRLVDRGSALGLGVGYLPWVLVGSAGALLFTVALSAFAQRLRREQYAGTLEALFTTPTPFSRVVLYSAAYDLLRILPQALVLLALAWWLGPRGATPGHVPLLAAFALSAAALFAGLGILAAAAVLAWQRGDPAVRLISGAAVLFGTAFFPAEALPGPLVHLPRLVPLTPALAGLRGCVLGTAPPGDLLAPLALVVAEAALLLPLGLLTFRRALAGARRRGTLARY